MVRKLFIMLGLMAAVAAAQTTTTVTGTIKDLAGNVVTSGQVTFDLQPGADTTISGSGRFVPTTITCLINGSGQLTSSSGSGSCVVTQNTALTPAGTYYLVTLWPDGVPSSKFNWYAVGSSQDITTVVPTPGTSPAYTFVDTTSDQTIGGAKIFTGPVDIKGGDFNGDVNGSLSPLSFGAKCDGTTDDAAALQAWLSAVVAQHGTGIVPDVTCAFYTPLAIPASVTGSNYAVVGRSPRATLAYLGSASATAAFWVEGSTSLPGGATNNGLLFQHLTILGNSHTQSVFECDACTRSVFDDLHLRGATETGATFLWGVGNALRRISVSVFDGPLAPVPVHGIVFGYLTDASHDCTAGQVSDAVVEGVSGAGIEIDAAKNLVFSGGLSEQNAIGVQLGTLAINNVFSGLDLEANSTADIVDDGISNLFEGNLASTLVHVESAARHESFRENVVGGITIDAGATGTSIVGNEYDVGGGEAITDNSTDGSTIRLGNTIAATGDRADNYDVQQLPRTVVGHITPAFDPAGPCRISIEFSSTASDLCAGPLAATSAAWRAVFIGEWGNDYDGANLPQLPPLLEVSSSSPAVTVGGDTVTFSVDATTLRLQGTESGSSERVAFSGTVFVISGNVGKAGEASATFAGTVAAAAVQNACSGVSAAMTAGTVTIANGCIVGSRPISLTEATAGGTQGILHYSQSAGTLTITSSSSTDTSTVSWVQH